MPFLLLFLKSINLFVFLFQYFFSYLEKSYAAFMMGQELDELGEYDQEFIENISKCFKNTFATLLSDCLKYRCIIISSFT